MKYHHAMGLYTALSLLVGSCSLNPADINSLISGLGSSKSKNTTDKVINVNAADSPSPHTTTQPSPDHTIAPISLPTVSCPAVVYPPPIPIQTPIASPLPSPVPSPTPIPTPIPTATATATATPFVHTFDTVFDDNDHYITNRVNVIKYLESGTATSYWGPSVAGQECSLTYGYQFATPIASASLDASETAFNWGYHYGYSRVEVSIDNATWINIGDLPKPISVPACNTKHIQWTMPANMLGSKNLYVKATMFSSEISSVADGQFERTIKGASSSIYSLTVINN